LLWEVLDELIRERKLGRVFHLFLLDLSWLALPGSTNEAIGNVLKDGSVEQHRFL
jgi:hypothetical protein